MTYRSTVELLRIEPGEMTVADLIEELQALVADAPCPADEMIFRFEQSGDQWDGYGSAEVSVWRPETEDEARAREEAQRVKEYAAAQAENERQRRLYEALRAKFSNE